CCTLSLVGRPASKKPKGTSCQEQANYTNQILKQVLKIVLPILLTLVILSMGCTTDIQKLWEQIKHPWAIILGLLCQFGIMPFTAFALSKAFNVLPLQAITIIIMGCCPGGAFSNILSYWMDGDMTLSISMTTCSTMLAMGMMPLCLLIYTSAWTSSSSIQIPYKLIGIMLASILAPVSVGIFIKHRWPTLAKKVIRVGSIAGILIIIIITVVGSILYDKSWIVPPSLWIIGVTLPLLGYGLGFLLARIARQPWNRCRTIALETGVQNSPLCSTIIYLSFTKEQLQFMFAFPVIYSISQPLTFLAAAGGEINSSLECAEFAFSHHVNNSNT
uniref:Ileal sodium/bile acid cotransporter n=1 Tax=Scleropages formosus TaxID=113540 RepID=A0A8C9RYH9_SCLFO